MNADDPDLVPLIPVRFSTVGDHIFYMIPSEYELFKNDPHVSLVRDIQES